jgi:filamentous hemagglutinin family protein
MVHRRLALLASALMLAPSGAFANPLGGQVVGGQASIQGQGTKTVTVTQGSNSAIINWNTFNIGTGEVTQFVQPSATSVALNRVIGGLGPSQLDGKLTANGIIFLVNPYGFVFGSGAQISTAGFLASTNDIRNADFMAGNYKFTIPGQPNASIVNYGTITAANGGFAALVAPGVRNAGTITADLGHVALASGNGFTLDFYGDKLITLQVGDAIASQVIDVSTGQPLDALVKNEGTLRANGGHVALTATAARTVVDSVINNTGVIEANSVGMKNGMIVLGAATAADKGAGAPKQTVKVSGSLSASGQKSGEKGGTIQITGENIALAGARLDASGQAGGGTVLVGGDTGGGRVNPAVAGVSQAQLQPWSVATASTVSIDAATVIDASAKNIGDGGKVVVWSDQATKFAGTIYATGGANGGNGGFAEVSSHGVLSYTGLADLSAPKGTAGTLLLDPHNVIICEDGCVDGDGATFANGTFTPNGDDSRIEVSNLQNQLQNQSVVVITGTAGSQDGNITVAVPIAWSSSNKLTLDAAHDIIINPNASIVAANGGLTLSAGNNINPSAAVNVGTFTLQKGYWSQVSTELPTFFANDFRIAGGTFLRARGGNGSIGGIDFQGSPYRIVDVYGLQGIGSQGLLSKNFVLAANIDATGTKNWNGGAGFVPIGTSGNPFTGTLDGRRSVENQSSVWTINGLWIAPVDQGITSIGLFGVNNGTIQNVLLTNASISANLNPNIPQNPNGGGPIGQSVGALAGQNFGQIINAGVLNSSINGGSAVNVSLGGLVGYNAPGALISTSYAQDVNVTSTASVMPSGSSCSMTNSCQWVWAGGLVGQNQGEIFGNDAVSPTTPCGTGQACASGGTVSVGSGGTAGGLVGSNDGIIFFAFATTTVSTSAAGPGGTDNNFDHATVLGGLAGQNQGWIDSSFASGDVGTSKFGFLKVGGLVGDNGGMISNSSAFGNVWAGDHSQAGGLAANNNVPDNNNNCSNTCGDGYKLLAGLSFDGIKLSLPDQFGFGFIINSNAGGNVTVGAASIAGGLAGTSRGTILASTSNGNVSGDHDSILGGFVGVGDFKSSNDFSRIMDSTAFGSVTGTGPNTIVAGFVGVNAGQVFDSQAAGGVNGSSNSYLGGFAGINIGLIERSQNTGVVNGTGSGNVVGGFVSVNVGLIENSATIGQVSSGPNSIVNWFAGGNLTFDNVPATDNQIPATGSTFPVGQIINPSNNPSTVTAIAQADFVKTEAAQSVVATGGSTPAFPGSTGTSGYPGLPSIVTDCSFCGFLVAGLQPPPPLPPSLPPNNNNNGPNDDLLHQQAPPNTQIVPPTFTNNNNTPILINLNTGPGPSGPAGGNGGNGNGGNGGLKPNYGPPPGLGLGRTADEQQYSGVPPPNETRFRNEIVVQVVDTVPVEQVVEAALKLGLVLISSQHLELTHRNVFSFTVPANADIRKIIVALEKINIVASTQPNYFFRFGQSAAAPAPTPAAPATVPAAPADTVPPANEAAPDLANSDTAALTSLPAGDAAQYVIDKFHLGDVHRLASGRNVLIAVIDSEIDAAHPDLRGVIAERFDATQSPSKPHAHGTGMAGAIASRYRLLGVAPGVRIIAIKAFDESATSAEATSYQILKGLDHAISKNVRIINMSFAGPRDPMMERTLKTAHDKGIILIAAAGNAGPKSPPLYPGADLSVIAVTATDYTDKPFAMANRGKYIAVAAPGVDVMVPAPANGYQLTTGTSVAAAHVSGVAALLVERKPGITPDEVRAILMKTATAFSAKPKGEEDGAGLVDPVGALKALTAPKTSDAVPGTGGTKVSVH